MDKSINYNKARAIRNRSIGDLISRNLMDDKGLGASVGKAVSDKFKAKVVGVKEKFDPLNIARKLTGNIGATLFGKMTGRSKTDISHFTGISGSRNQDPLHTKISDGQNQRLRKGDALADVLARLYNLTKKYHAEEVERMEMENNFKKERQAEKERWQEELLKAITGLNKNLKNTAEKEEEPKEDTSGLSNFIKNAVEADIMKRLGLFLMGPEFAALLATAASIAVINYFAKKAVAEIPNGSNLSPSEADAALRGSVRDIEALGGREKLEETVRTGKQKAQAIKDMPEGEEKKKAIRDYGGQKKLDEVLADTNTYTVPDSIDEGPAKIPPRPDTTGGKNQGRAGDWDRKWGSIAKNYDAQGNKISYTGPQRRLDPTIEPSKAGAGRGTYAEIADYERRQLETGDRPVNVPNMKMSLKPKATATPVTAPVSQDIPPAKNDSSATTSEVPTTKPMVAPVTAPNPLASKMQQVVNQNNDLTLDQTVAGQTIVVDNSKTINKTTPGQESFAPSGSVPVRNGNESIKMKPTQEKLKVRVP